MRGLLLPPGGSASRSASEQTLATHFFPVTYLLEEVHAQALALLRMESRSREEPVCREWFVPGLF